MIAHLLGRLEQEFDGYTYGTSPKELYEPIEYIMALGGKRFRPLLTLLAARLFTENWETALRPAMAVEVFHNFTLMHDDIMDKAPIRRGKATVHEKWSENTAILSGDVMLVRAYDLLADVDATKLARVLVRFGRTAAEVCEGQQLDMLFEQRANVTHAEYLEMIRLKTSVLLGFALELGGILGGADDATVRDLYVAGVDLGLGFQLKDDLLDVYGDPKKFGKQVGGDILANKKTFLLIEALERAEGDLKERLMHWLRATDFDPTEKVQAVTAIYDELGVKAHTEQLIQSFFSKGFDLLNKLRDSESKAELLGFVRQLIDREK